MSKLSSARVRVAATVLASFVLVALNGCNGGAKAGSADRRGAGGTGGADGVRQGYPGRGDGDAGGRRGEEAPSAPRTVSSRSPFGNLEPGNLVMNGDFELGIGAVVPGWYAVADDHVMPFRYRTGGACRSGLLCAEIAAGQALVATMVSLPDGGPATVVAHAKPRSGRSEDVTVRLTLQSLAATDLGSITLVEQGAPDQVGFVRYEATFEVDRPYDVVGLVVDARDSTLIDDVSVRAGAPEGKAPFARPDAVGIPPSVARVTWLAREEARTQRFAPASPRGLPATVTPRWPLPR